jgi:hypothetical protein
MPRCSLIMMLVFKRSKRKAEINLFSRIHHLLKNTPMLTVLKDLFLKYIHKSPTSITIIVAALCHILTALGIGVNISDAALSTIDKIAVGLVAVFIPDGSTAGKTLLQRALDVIKLQFKDPSTGNVTSTTVLALQGGNASTDSAA